MDTTIHHSFLPHTDPEASLAFDRDTLGFHDSQRRRSRWSPGGYRFNSKGNGPWQRRDR